MQQLKDLIEDERLLILHSGEIPEIAYHGSIYHLTEDSDGPKISINALNLTPLKEAVVLRYQTIILRDLDHRNRDKRIYRGMARAIVNYNRLIKFAGKEGMDIQGIQMEIRDRVIDFLRHEVLEVLSHGRPTCLNCEASELKDFLQSLQIEDKDLLEKVLEILLRNSPGPL
jgi:hypothetical protein